MQTAIVYTHKHTIKIISHKTLVTFHRFFASSSKSFTILGCSGKMKKRRKKINSKEMEAKHRKSVTFQSHAHRDLGIGIASLNTKCFF